MKDIFRELLLAAGLLGPRRCRGRRHDTLRSRGRRFLYPIYAKWADAYKKLTGVGLNYQSIGSGGGIKQIKAKTVTFGRIRHAPEAPEDLEGRRTTAVSDDHRRRVRW